VAFEWFFSTSPEMADFPCFSRQNRAF